MTTVDSDDDGLDALAAAAMLEDGPACAAKLDAADPLRSFRAQFHLPTPSAEEGLERFIYFDGNSLGLQPVAARAAIDEALSDWRMEGAKREFGPGGVGYGGVECRRHPQQDQCAAWGASMVGAKTASEVCWMNALTVNLHLLLASFYRPAGARRKILMEAGAFPSDQYAAATQAQLHGLAPAEAILTVAPREGERLLRTEDIVAAIETAGEELALVLFSGVHYGTGQLFDLGAIASAATRVGARCGLDLAHAVGNVRLELHSWGVDFAAWCGYKYCNGGPGSLGGIFVHENHHGDASLLKLGGWWAQKIESRFSFPVVDAFDPIAGAAGFQPSNPPPLLLAPLCAALELWAEAGAERITAKARRMTSFMQSLLERSEGLGPEVVEVVTPQPPYRGAQLSIRLLQTQGLGDERIDGGGGTVASGATLEGVHKWLGQRGVVCDLRRPDMLRFAPAPLYNTYEEVFAFVALLSSALRQA